MTPRRTTLLKALVSLILLSLILSRFDPTELWHTIQTANLQYMLIGALLSPLILFLKVIKWQEFVRQLIPVSLGETGISLLAGIGIGLVTPGRVGELARISYVPANDKTRFLGLAVVDRLLDLTAILAAGALTIGFALDVKVAVGLMLPVGLGVALLFVPGLPHRLVRWVYRIRLMPGKNQLQKIGQGLSVLNGWFLLTILFLAVCTFLLGVYQFYWLLRSLGVNAPLASAISFPILTVAGVIPITISGFGIREGAAVLVLSQYGIPEAVALNATLLSFFLNTFIPGMIGLLISPLSKSRRQPSAE